MDALPGLLRNAIILIEVIVLFNLLIIVHELGHFLAARWRGLVVEKFGIWFGKPIWKKTINGVEYSLGSIPAGGFVALPQMAPMEAIEGKGETDRAALPPVSWLDKIIVAFAGPLFSFLLAVAFAVIVMIVGKPVRESDSSLEIGWVAKDSSAYKVGLRPGDVIKEVDGRPVKTFNGMSESVVWNVVSSEGKTIPVKVVRDGQEMVFEPEPFRSEQKGFGRAPKRLLLLEAAATPVVGEVKPGSAAERAGFKANDLLLEVEGRRVRSLADLGEAQDTKPGEALSVVVQRGKDRVPLQFPPTPRRVGSVTPKSPAELAGIKKDDVIVSADGEPVTSGRFAKLATERLNQPVKLVLKRNEQTVETSVTPLMELTNKRAMIGIGWAADDDLRWDDWGLLKLTYPKLTDQIVQPVQTMVNTFSALVSSKSELSVRDLSGPVGIGRIYFHLLSGEQGWRLALWFSVFMNVNLALMNLLPIPVLDGGHIVLALVEAARRKPMSLRVLEWVQTSCALVIIGFMLYVTVFDVLDIPFLKRRQPAAELKFAPADATSTAANG